MNKIFFSFTLLAAMVLKTYSQSEPIVISGFAQGTTYQIKYYDEKNRNLKKEIDQLFDNFNKSVSLYDSTSIISRVNSNEKNVILDEYFKVCFNKSIDVSKATDGAFDATVGPLVSSWGFSFKQKIKMDSLTVDSILKFVGYHLVEIKNGKVVKKDPRVKLDFNALAQGYSVDLVSKLLDSNSISNYLVELGGEIFAKGKKSNGDFWTVGIEKPENNSENQNPLIAKVKLHNKALNTSGNYRKFYIENGVKYSHEINPKSGYPAHNSLLSATVLADDCMTADAYATAFMVMGLERSIKFLSEHKELMGYLIYSDEKNNYKIYESSGFKEILTEAEK